MLRSLIGRMFVFALLAVATVALAGCGGPTIDASSEEAFKKSADEIKKTLDDAKKQEFDQALATLMFSKVLHAPGAFGDEAGMKKAMKEAFQGKTADQVIAEASKEKAVNKAEIEKLMQQ